MMIETSNEYPLQPGDAAMLHSGSNVAMVSVRAVWPEDLPLVLVQLKSDPDDRRVVNRKNLRPSQTDSVRFDEIASNHTMHR